MRRITIAFAILIMTTINITIASADSTIIYLTSKPHQLFDQTFRNDELVNDLLATGRLGKPLESKPSGNRTWVIDGQLLDEVAEMANGYKLSDKNLTTGELVAKSWLSRLLLITSGDKVIALPYGNPDVKLARSAAPNELNFYINYGIERVVFHLNRKTSPVDGTLWSTGRSKLTTTLRRNYTENRQALSTLSTVVKSDDLRAQRAKLAILLSPSLSKSDRDFFNLDAIKGVKSTQSKLRVSAGKYQIASESGQVPITIINSFDLPVRISLKLTPLNSRIQVNDVSDLIVGANSRTQLSIPFIAIAPGATTVIAQITNSKGGLIGPSARLAINTTFINSQVTWFTIGSAFLLFAAALTQTIRRIRRGRNEK